MKYKTLQNRFAIAGVTNQGAAESYTISGTAEAPEIPDYTGGEHALVIYISIVDQIIGNTLAPLLRVVRPEAKNLGQAVASEKYIKPYYTEVSKSFIDVIDIQIRTTTGKLYPFIRCKTIMGSYQRSVDDYYLRHAKAGPYFQGSAYQRGHGLGDIFRALMRVATSIFRTAAPMVKTVVTAVAKGA